MVRKTGAAVRVASGGNPIGPWLQRAISDGKAEIFSDGRREKIRYKAVDHVEHYGDPEEWVRADFWAELIYRYGYSEERIGIEVSVPDRLPGDFADLVVCHDDARTKPYAVIEAKPEGVTEAEFEQAVEQAVGNGTWSKLRADYVMVVAGTTRRVLDVVSFGISERTKNIVADLPNKYQNPAAFRFFKGSTSGEGTDLRVATRDEMIAVLRKCHNTLWGGGHLTPPQAFSELCKVIFVKIADEKQTRRGKPYQVQIKTGEDPRGLYARVEQIYNDHRRGEPDIFTSDLSISPEKLRSLVEHIQGINIASTDIDIKGVAFERFMDSFFKGDFGQYFTPREIIAFAVSLIEVEPSEYVIDPACGSAGFLLQALDVVRTKVDEYQTPGTEAHFRMWSDFANHQLFGIEINDEIARVAKMNMILHGDGHANIVCHDALKSEASLSGLNRGIKFWS
ncbi:MAG: restriction endonuclease subunit M [Acidimicrobiia bacterium]